MTRRKLVAGNWKMNGSLAALAELDAIAAVAVGGTLLAGGKANVLGTLLGAFVLQLVRTTLLANGVPDAAAAVALAAGRAERWTPVEVAAPLDVERPYLAYGASALRATRPRSMRPRRRSSGGCGQRRRSIRRGDG